MGPTPHCESEDLECRIMGLNESWMKLHLAILEATEMASSWFT